MIVAAPYTARIAVFNEDNKVLLQQKSLESKNAGGMWELPGGKIDYTTEEKNIRRSSGLSLERTSLEAVLDELQEEKNIDLRDVVANGVVNVYTVGTLEYSFFDVVQDAEITRSVIIFATQLPEKYYRSISKTGLPEDKLATYEWCDYESVRALDPYITQNSKFYTLIGWQELLHKLQT